VLFEQEVPEIYEGQVRIMAIARDPGNRAKVAVQATEEGIDAVGTCVGVKGTRVQNIISELDGEKIDLVEWSEDISAFIANALGRRAGVRRVELDDESKSAHVIVPDDKLSLAIGQRGQNARLAARLTGWKVDIKGESEASVSINELFKPSPDEEKTDTTDSVNSEENNEIEAQGEDTTDTIISEVETAEVQEEDESVINSEEGDETNESNASVEKDDFDTESK
jgi:N utilization substance protein A